ncbi:MULTISPECIES: hypothetical protein [unclassified Mesorhizobium]|uniref:hypothetical protein n=1 Tax=unclassified Mesorhizobium TaxID=325217 RepID=UPI000FCBB3EB|nr:MULTISPECIES: hypothetical protein [unclassified Mesorhizobium]RUV55596.1 hypothetical protein EOA85_21055 [Mesorhizobium sp. M5C.F.Ca.IN.020.29.1.1]RWC21143.1 MAG: hypothetical protein EOS51_12310 [Mesorhizobium sp.]RWD83252.1 MAG: hypothetical protein EOS48_11345 [Mesorhizobium sp.]RWE58427.1 MAG: hypothetical protein EOS67_13650 [Mesorhizobium sp.]RWE98474.1 MAG: hypothetical protein EOS68_13830 [Mesorhizobium sp.]
MENQFTDRRPIIAYADALQLVATNNWQFDTDLHRLPGEAHAKLVRADPSFATAQVPHGPRVLEAMAGFHETLTENFESKALQEPPARFNGRLLMHVRISHNAVFRVSPAILDSMFGVAGIAVLVASAPSAALLGGGLAISVAELVRRLSAHFVKIHDPVEKAVFQQVCVLAAKTRVNDPVALEEGRYEEAIGPVIPDRRMIVESLKGEYQEESVERAISDLVNKQVLQEAADHRITVAF